MGDGAALDEHRNDKTGKRAAVDGSVREMVRLDSVDRSVIVS